MGWTHAMRRNRYPSAFKNNGNYRSNSVATFATDTTCKNSISEDTKNRKDVLNQIETRILQGEELNKIVEDLSQQREIIEKFSYYQRNGVANLAQIFKNWYLGYEKSKNRDSNFMR